MSASDSDDSPASEAALSAVDGLGAIAAEVDLDVTDASRYRVDRLLGVGGMGRVTAVHDRRLGRDVALKEPRSEVGNSVVLRARLAREAWITARIEHPGIPPIYDAGTRPDGSVYYTMPIVRGRSLAERLSGAAPSVRQGLLRRVLEAAEAVGAAHAAHTIHRDLKPANIMIGDDGATRVVDWGLARVIGQGPNASTLEPEQRHSTDTNLAGTLLYMSPELLDGGEPDTRSDVWSLGAILYEVCAGSRLRPSAERDAIASPRVVLARQSPEIAAIIERAIGPRDRRYPDARAFAEDLSRYLDGERVTAHEYSAGELLSRFVRLWRVPLIVAAIALAVVTVLVIVGLLRLAREVERAQAAESQSRDALTIADQSLASSLASQASMSSLRGAQAEAEILAAAALSYADSPAMRGILLGWSAHRRPELLGHEPVPDCLEYDFGEDERILCRTESTVEVWARRPLVRVWRYLATTSSAVWWGGDVAVYTGVREYLVLAGATGRLLERQRLECGDRLFAVGDFLFAHNSQCLWSTPRDGARSDPAIWPCPGSYVAGTAITGAGARWAATCANGDLVTGDLDAESGTLRRRALALADGQVILTLVFLDGDRLALGSNHGEVFILDGDRLGPALVTGRDQVDGLIASTSGELVVATGAVGAPLIIDTRAGIIVGQLPEGLRRDLRFLGDALFDLRAELTRWRPRLGPPGAFEVDGGVTSLAFSPEGKSIAATFAGGVVVRRRGDGMVVLSTAGSDPSGVPKAAVFGPDGRDIYIAAGGYLIENAWNIEGGTPFDASSAHMGLRRIGALANGWLVAVPYSVGVAVFPPSERSPWHEIATLRHQFNDLAVSAAGHHAVAYEPSVAAVWLLSLDARTFEPRLVDAGALAVAIGRGPELVATAGQNGASLWNADNGALLRHFAVPGRELVEVALAPDERYLAAGSKDGLVLVWEVGSGELRAVVSAHEERVAALAFSPDGQVLASGGWDGRVRVYDLDTLDLPAGQLTERMEAAWGVRLDAIIARDNLP